MDLREKKTKRSIKNAFLQLRAIKALEKITVKELAELAEISKATFYIHYRDIYDLSEQLQQEVIKNILDSIIEPGVQLFDTTRTTYKLFHAFCSQQALIDILFSGTQSSVLPLSIENGIKQYAYQVLPNAQNDVKFNVLLSFQIYGAYYAYAINSKYFDNEGVLKCLDEISNQIQGEIMSH